MKEIVPEDINNTEKFKEWLPDNFSGYILDLLQKRYKNKKCMCEVIKAYYKDTSSMLIFGYHIKDKSEDDDYISGMELEEFCLPELTRAEEHYIRNNLSEDVIKIAKTVGLKEGEVKEYIQNA